jgi:ribose 5-phosphate isomerase B
MPEPGRAAPESEVRQYDSNDDYPDSVIPLARAVAAGTVERGVLLCGSGIGGSIAAKKVDGVRADVSHNDFSARQGVEDDDMNILCLGGRTRLREEFSCHEVHRGRAAPPSSC